MQLLFSVLFRYIYQILIGFRFREVYWYLESFMSSSHLKHFNEVSYLILF